jgi:hypothetical protein
VERYAGRATCTGARHALDALIVSDLVAIPFDNPTFDSGFFVDLRGSPPHFVVGRRVPVLAGALSRLFEQSNARPAAVKSFRCGCPKKAQ